MIEDMQERGERNLDQRPKVAEKWIRAWTALT